MSQRWFTSDLHFGHANVISYCDRPFLNLQEMDEALIYRWNTTVAPQDTVYVLGDFSFYKPEITRMLLTGLNGRKFLIEGNHDKSKLTSRKPEEYLKMGWEWVWQYKRLKLANGVKVMMSHFPYRCAQVDDRYALEHFQDDGKTWLLHGHVHQHWRLWDRMINVGADVWNYTPVSEWEIIECIEKYKPVEVPAPEREK